MWNIDAANFGRDFMGNGESTFTQGGDVIGKFSYDTMHTVDMATGSPDTTSKKTLQYSIEQLSLISPPIITFISTLEAEESTGDKFVRYVVVGRIMNPEVLYSTTNVVDRVKVVGEVISVTPLRVAS